MSLRLFLEEPQSHNALAIPEIPAASLCAGQARLSKAPDPIILVTGPVGELLCCARGFADCDFEFGLPAIRRSPSVPRVDIRMSRGVRGERIGARGHENPSFIMCGWSRARAAAGEAARARG
jgi:hypothetical protein